MSKKTRYILLAMPLLFAACEKETGAPSKGGDNCIRIGVEMAETKARMGASDLKNANTRLTVYGYNETDNAAVFDGLIATPPSQGSQQGAVKVSNWDIKDDKGASLKPEWTDGKDYTFFAWTQQDAFGNIANGTSGLFKAGFNYSPAKTTAEGEVPAKLAIAATELPISADIMDFCYSNVETRSTNNDATSRPNYSMIELKLEHLFTGFSLSAHNYSGQTVVITSLILDGIYNKKSAVITFDTDPDKGVSAKFDNKAALSNAQLLTSSEISAGGITVESNSSVANVAKGSGSDTKYFLMWPQTKAELAAAKLKVSYKVGGVAQTPVELSIPGDEVSSDTEFSWPAGVCRNIELSFTSKSLKLKVTPKPWNQTTPAYDYNGAASVEEQLKLVSGGVINPEGSKNVFFKSAEPIILSFFIKTPLNASWMVEKIGDFDAFEIDNISDSGTGVVGDGIDTKEGVIDGSEAKIAIYPKISDPQKDYKIQLSFTVRGNDGTVIDINGITATTGVQGGTDKSKWYTFYILK